MHLILATFAVAVLAGPVQMTPTNQFEMELSLLKMKIGNLEKSDSELKKQIEEMQNNEERMKQKIVKMGSEISDLKKNEIDMTKKLAKLETRTEDINNKEEMKIIEPALVKHLEKIEIREDQNDGLIFRNPGMENIFDGKISDHENDCCGNLTDEINQIKTNMEHFIERIDDNTMKIITNQFDIQLNTIKINENQLEIQLNTENTDDNTKKIIENQLEIQLNTENTDTLMKSSEYCSFQNLWHPENHPVIRYDKLFLSNNQDIPDAEMDIDKGEFTAGVSGIYEINVSMRMMVYDNQNSTVYLHQNGINVAESIMYHQARQTVNEYFAGRSMMLRLEAGDTLSVYAENLSFNLGDIIFCINLLK